MKGKSEKRYTNNKKNAIVRLTATIAVLASLATGALFSTIDDITPELKRMSLNQPPVVMDIDEFGNATLEEDDDVDDEKKGNGGIIMRIRQAIVSLPIAVRLLIISPLWVVGILMMTVVSLFGRIVAASPVGAFIMSVAVGFGVLLALFVATARFFFPDVPISKMLTKNNVITLLVIAIGLAGADAVAPLFWSKYAVLSGLVKFCVGALAVGMCLTEVKEVKSKLGLK